MSYSALRAPFSPSRVEAAIEKRFGFQSTVIHRTPEELRAIVARNPSRRRGIKLGGLVVPGGRPGRGGAGEGPRARHASRKLHVEACELYIYFPDGMARPKLNLGKIDRALGVTATARNWNTVTSKLLEMAEEL